MEGNLEIGGKYLLLDVVLSSAVGGMELGDINATYLGIHLAHTSKKIVHNFGIKESEDTCRVYHILEENILRIDGEKVIPKGRYYDLMECPIQSETDALRQTRLRHLEILSEVAA